MRKKKEAFWHTSAHIMAQAVKRLYPDTKCAIGPAIENGFYYDFEFSFSFTDEHLKAVETEMRKIVKESLSLQVYEVIREDAISYMEKEEEPYKLEMKRIILTGTRCRYMGRKQKNPGSAGEGKQGECMRREKDTA